MTPFFQEDTLSSTANFPTDPQVVIPFEPLGFYICAPATDDPVAWSLDGVNVSGVVEGGQALLFQPATVQKIWLKHYSGSGTCVSRVIAFTT